MTLRSTRVLVITEPDQLDQEWIDRLAAEPDIDVLDRIGLLNIGLERIQQLKPDFAIIERSTDQVESAIRRLFLSMPTTLCIAIVASADIPTVRRLVGAGARDVVAQPVDYADLIAGLRATIAAEKERRKTSTGPLEEAPVQARRGRLIAVTSPKGGVGTTTVATNLAVALHQLTSARVLLADMDLQFGDVGVLLNVRSKHTVRDLFPRIYDIDDNLLNAVLQQHNTGIQVLLAPDTPDAVGNLDTPAFNALLESLLERFDYVVCDTWSFLDDLSVLLLENADEVLV
ncbi:MAG TPA: AAA family ATPase, partial [Roseiflexaceae bacterium]|nr:AAA family ATPase [Roseiflexaceae bacterium]